MRCTVWFPTQAPLQSLCPSSVTHCPAVLRSTLVARTREWNSPEVRKSTADECATLTGYEDLAAILRSKRCVLLRKVHLLYLSRVWNYRSDKWARRGDRARRPSSTAVAAAAAAVAAAASPNACPLAVSAPVQPEAVMTYVAKTLRPLALESAHLAAGGRACEAARSCSAGEAAYLTADTLCELRSVQGHFSAAQSAAAGVHAALCDEAHALSQDEAVQPAWSCLSSDAQAAESLVQGLVQLCSALASDTQRRGASPRLSTCQAVWLDELWQCQLLASECAARAHLVLLRIKTQPRAPFLQGAAVIMEALLNFLSSSRAHLARREAWVTRLIALRPAVGDSSPSALTRAAVAKPVAPPALAELSPVLYAVVGAYAGSGSPAAVCGAVHGGPIKPESSADVPGGGAILAAMTARDGSCA